MQCSEAWRVPSRNSASGESSCMTLSIVSYYRMVRGRVVWLARNVPVLRVTLKR